MREVAMVTDWSALLADMVTAKQRLADSDRDGLWRHEPPRPPATPQRIAEISAVTHCPLDPEYADFLRHADGWPAILQDIDLFGTADFGSAAYAEAEELVRVIEDEVEIERGASRAPLIPIGASRTDIDILVMPWEKDLPCSGPVIWLAGAEIERYRTFSDFFRGMIAHNLKEANDLA
ncbi:SMI1/KNR4 family protein [Streptomyces sp. DT2A-34]|uniref:SMI1/KNR4 family protein n=1 Tax=Streptomyces sp. DT2A-34 TaxID=3051182 RepID=UPI00265B8535|nr:SMI1/KNR4 family protein [Streptomyces sp. DT2A-34]MDO0914301.1 SMI1/KNR4 family protein [Streptomyces sp. DT2A-34]